MRLALNAVLFVEFKTNKPSDVISTLVSIYDSKDLFVKELQVLLAQRLLAIKNNDMERIDKEVRVSQPTHSQVESGLTAAYSEEILRS